MLTQVGGYLSYKLPSALSSGELKVLGHERLGSGQVEQAISECLFKCLDVARIT